MRGGRALIGFKGIFSRERGQLRAYQGKKNFDANKSANSTEKQAN